MDPDASYEFDAFFSPAVKSLEVTVSTPLNERCVYSLWDMVRERRVPKLQVISLSCQDYA